MGMTFIPTDELHSVLYAVLPEYKPISAAPYSFSSLPKDLQVAFNSDSQAFERFKIQEAKRRYKAIDKFGRVYLIQNPWCWKSFSKLGNETYFRPLPEVKMTWEQAKTAARRAIPADSTGSFDV